MKFDLVNFGYLPDIKEFNRLLDIIHQEKKPSLSDISHKIDKPIILHGAGNLGKMAKLYFDKLNINTLFVTDKNSFMCNEDPFWISRNIEVTSPYAIPYQARKLCEVVVCNVTTSFNEIKNELWLLGFENIIPFYDITLSYQDKHPLSNGWITSLMDTSYIKNIKYVASKLNDDISRAHYLQFIGWHSIRQEWIFKDAPISNDNRYFIPEILKLLHDNETFIDVGAHHGEVVNKFTDIVNNNFDSIYAFEPDKDNISVFLSNIKESVNKCDIHLIPKALGNKEEIKKFYHGLGYSSQLSELSNEHVRVTTLDNLKITPTLIKIHSEGCEYEIIEGGLKTIKLHRPIIITTSYHNRNGLWKLPLQLMNNTENYIYYFRLHSWCGTGAVIYAIPKECTLDTQ